jgi:hypothetical protein
LVKEGATRPERPLWASAWFWGGMALIATGPFLFASIPPMADFPGHVGRYHIMLDLGRSPYLQRFYGFKWTLIGNLGVDLLMMAVGPVLGAERGAWLIAGLTPALMVMGIFAVSRVVHGRVQPTSFLALPFVYASAFEWGFLNYDLAVALALLALALWIAWRGRPRLRSVVFIPLAFGLWVCHAAGWGLLGLLVGGYELQAAIGDRGWRPTALGQAALRVLPLAPPALFSVGTVFRGATPYDAIASVHQTATQLIAWKLFVLIDQLHDRIHGLDVASGLILVGLFLLALSRGALVSSALVLPAALICIATILIPPIVGGIDLADYRLAPVAAIVVVLAMQAGSMRWPLFIVVCALALTGVRLVVTAWHADSKAYERHLTALNAVPMGARILALVPTVGGAAPHWSRPMSHLADLAIVRRDALVNTQWTIANAQLLHVNANADIAWHADPSQFVASDKIGQSLATAPLDRFDFVWVLGRYPAGPAPGRLVPVYADDETRLFRVTR